MTKLFLIATLLITFVLTLRQPLKPIKTIIVLHKRDGIYHLYKRNPLTADLLAGFLTDDVGRSASLYIEDLENNEYAAGARNYSQYETEDGIVTITPEWVIDSDESIAKGHFFQIKTTTLIDLLEQWDVVFNQRPHCIIITIIDDKVSITGTEKLPEKLLQKQ